VAEPTLFRFAIVRGKLPYELMKWMTQAFPAIGILAAFALVALPSPAADSITNFGLLHMPLGQAFVSGDGSSMVNNLGTNGGDGVSIFLGESDSGIFFSPSVVNDPEPGDFLHAEVYGQLNGVTNQLLATVRGWNVEWSQYSASVDFSPLGGSSLTLVAFSGSQLVGTITNVDGNFSVGSGGWGNPLRRVAPFWRMPDGSIGALFEFLWPTWFGAGGFPTADRYFVRVENPTNAVGFVSRIDITSQDLPQIYGEPETNYYGSGVLAFSLWDVRLGMFHRPHLTFGSNVFHAAEGRLTTISDPDALATVAVELERNTVFHADLLPIDLSGEGSSVTVSGIGNAAGIAGSDLGVMRIEQTNESLRISAQFSIAPRFAQIVVLAGGIPVGTNGIPREEVWVTTTDFRRVIGSGLLARTLNSLPGFTVRLDATTTFSTPNGNRLIGDEVHLLASDPAHFESLDTFVITTVGLPSFTIVEESSAPFTPPLVRVVRSGTNVVFSWPDPNEIFLLEGVLVLSSPADAGWPPEGGIFETVTNTPSFANDFRSLKLPVDFTAHRFFRLRHGEPRPPREVD
jgi:hypothetical protein